MPWKRGAGSVEWELSRVQEWIEDHDLELHGDGSDGNLGVIKKLDKLYTIGSVGLWMFGSGTLVSLATLGLLIYRTMNGH